MGKKSTTPATQHQGSKATQGKQAKKDASSNSQKTKKQPVEMRKPMKTTPVKDPKEKFQKKFHVASSHRGGKHATGKRPGEQNNQKKTTPFKDERYKAQKRSRDSEDQLDESLAEKAERQVMIRYCPISAVEKDVKKIFPNATELHFVKKGGIPTGTCFVLFETPEEAVEASQKKGIRINGHAVLLYLASIREEIMEEEAEREILISHCPLNTEIKDIKKLFPNAVFVHMLKRDEKFVGSCFVFFATPNEAVAASRKKLITIKDGDARVALLRPKQAMQRCQLVCQIVIENCPPKTTKADLKKAFPKAKKFSMVRKNGWFTGTCFATFVTSREADAACQRKDVTIRGQLVQIGKADSNETRHQDELMRQIVIGKCPKNVTEEDVKKAFPKAKKVSMVRKNGWFTGTCFATFATSDEADAACRKMDVTIRGQLVQVGKPGQSQNEEPQECEVTVTNCPLDVDEKDVEQIFSGAQEVIKQTKDGEFTGTCFVRFSTRDKAIEASKKTDLTIKERTVDVSLSSDGPAPAKRRKLAA